MKNIKIFVVIIIAFLSMKTVIAQSLDSVMLKRIEFKAKLLTTSLYGIAEEETILNEILSQEVTFIFKSDKLLIMKIPHEQTYYIGDSTKYILLVGNCANYIAYNHQLKKFYKINSNCENDIIDFFSDLNETRIPFTQLLNIKEINFLGLFSEFAFIDDEEKEVIDYVDDCSKSLDTVIRIE
jgi:hypothetical protein